MTRKEFEARTEFEHILMDEAEQLNNGALPAWSRRQNAMVAARLLCRHGKSYARIQEAICNGPALSDYAQAHWDAKVLQRHYDRHEQWCERREQQLEKRIRTITAGIGAGFGVIFSGDPRGSTVKITVPSGRTNDWGKEGICVPTA